ncbi:DUF2934 domain-containing protein [Oleiharenicola lentus]|uniref:DUF2934 domain-containing protein n=1 Tax=Oleiharenicola lentus TaxID=2508720 RepID=UPI003F675567
MNSHSTTPFSANLSHDEIAKRAYDIWEACGRPADKEHEHWTRAERELSKDRQQADECRSSFGDKCR